jgi:hypothetical protein
MTGISTRARYLLANMNHMGASDFNQYFLHPFLPIWDAPLRVLRWFNSYMKETLC